MGKLKCCKAKVPEKVFSLLCVEEDFSCDKLEESRKELCGEILFFKIVLKRYILYFRLANPYRNVGHFLVCAGQDSHAVTATFFDICLRNTWYLNSYPWALVFFFAKCYRSIRVLEEDDIALKVKAGPQSGFLILFCINETEIFKICNCKFLTFWGNIGKIDYIYTLNSS